MELSARDAKVMMVVGLRERGGEERGVPGRSAVMARGNGNGVKGKMGRGKPGEVYWKREKRK